MPPKNYRRKPMTKKPSYAKAKRVVAKVQKAKRKGNADTFSLLCKSQFLIQPSQSATGPANYIYGFLPLQPDSDWAESLWSNQDFQLYRTLYDRFRVNSCLIQWNPRANVLDMNNGNNDALNNTGDNLIHYVIDRDGKGPSNITTMQKYSSYSKSSVMKKHSRKYGVQYPKSVWLDTAQPMSKSQLSTSIGLQGGITYYGENYLEDGGEIWNEPLGTFTIWYRVVFQGRTAGKVSFDNETGRVCIDPTESLPTKERSPIYAQHGTITPTRLVFDASGIPHAIAIDEAND